MRIVIDTNRYRDFSEGVKEAVDRLRAAEQVCLPFVVLAELRAGPPTSTRGCGVN